MKLYFSYILSTFCRNIHLRFKFLLFTPFSIQLCLDTKLSKNQGCALNPCNLACLSRLFRIPKADRAIAHPLATQAFG